MRHYTDRAPERGNTLLLLVAIASSICMTTASTAADLVTVTPEVLLRDASGFGLHDIGIPRFIWAGDGAGLIVNVAGPLPHVQDAAGAMEAGAQVVSLEYVGTRGKRVFLGRGKWTTSAPDGRRIAYRTGDDSWRMHTVVLVTPDGREICRLRDTALSSTATGIEGMAWSPDGDRLVVVTTTRDRDRAQRQARAAPIRVYANEPMTTAMSPEAKDDVSIWSIDAACSSVHHVVDLPYAYVADIAWLADGQSLVARAMAREAGLTHTRADLLFIDVRDGAWRSVVRNVGWQTSATLVPSPDGRLIAFDYDEEGMPDVGRQMIGIASVTDGSLQMVSQDLRSKPQWTPDGRHLWLSAEAPHELLRRKVIASLDGTEIVVPDLPGSAQLSPQGNRVAWTETDLYGESALWVADIVPHAALPNLGNRRRLLQVASPLARYRRGERRLLRWPSGDGLTIAGILILPVDYHPGRRYPLIVDLHGGPQKGLMGSSGNPTPGALLVTSSLEADLWAAKGYVVLMPDYRGSGMYGFQAIDATRKDASIDDRDIEDIMSSVDTVIAQGIADKSRMVVIGHSHGALLTNWIVTHSHRFRAAISYEGGSASPWLVWGAMGTVNRYLNILYGSALEYPERYWRRSALGVTHGVTTPVLWVADYGGARLGNVYAWLHAAWLFQGVETQYRIYAENSHVLRDPDNQRDLLTAGIEWVDRHLTAASTGSSTAPPATATR